MPANMPKEDDIKRFERDRDAEQETESESYSGRAGVVDVGRTG
jgi:hypothetical protein